METAKAAQPIMGNKLYQQRARKAFPILVRQALAGTPILYSDLANEIEMTNPRNLNYVLGSIGKAIKNLSEKWSEEIPPIQCLVINKHTGIPGKGIGWFITNVNNFSQLPRKQQRQLIKVELQKIFLYQKWPQVLQEFSLEPSKIKLDEMITQVPIIKGGSESNEHRELKEYLAKHPEIVGLPKYVGIGQKEYPLPSGDTLDVFFCRESEHIGIEIKSIISTTADIVRGIFQCVKYRAVIEAKQSALGLPQNARVVLILGGAFPNELRSLKNILGVEVIDNVEVIKSSE
jgi:hypothetical protein